MLQGIVDIDHSSELRLSEQIYRQVRLAVRDRTLSEGQRMPASRYLAKQLGVSRNTVTEAYERLKAERIIIVRPGAVATIAGGATLRGLEGDEPSRASSIVQLSERGSILSQNSRMTSRVSTGNLLEAGVPAMDLFPRDSWARALRRASRGLKATEVFYEHLGGLPSLRTHLANLLAQTRGVATTPQNILICTSTQAALSLLAACLANEGDQALIEEPGYLGARGAFAIHGLKLQAMPVDVDGAMPPVVSKGVQPRLIYLTPSHQYPLGYSMSLSRRLSFIEYARRVGAVILEDDYDSEFLFSNRPVASLQGLSAGSEVIYLGTFAKSMLPGLRVAYMVVPHYLAEGLSQAIRNLGIMASAPVQAGLATFIETGEYRAHLKRIKAIYQERGAALVEALCQAFGKDVDILAPSGGVQLVMKFRSKRDDVALAHRLQELGVGVSPLSTTYLEEGASGLIIGFSGAVPQTIKAGVAAMKAVI